MIEPKGKTEILGRKPVPLSLVIEPGPLRHMKIFSYVYVRYYEGESDENLKYVLSRNLLNTKGTQ